MNICQGCAPTNSVLLECRHQSVACALAMSERYGVESVGIAVGPAAGDTHSQAYLLEGERIAWIEGDSTSCYIGKKDNFNPERYMTVAKFIETFLVEITFPASLVNTIAV